MVKSGETSVYIYLSSVYQQKTNENSHQDWPELDLLLNQCYNGLTELLDLLEKARDIFTTLEVLYYLVAYYIKHTQQNQPTSRKFVLLFQSYKSWLTQIPRITVTNTHLCLEPIICPNYHAI